MNHALTLCLTLFAAGCAGTVSRTLDPPCLPVERVAKPAGRDGPVGVEHSSELEAAAETAESDDGKRWRKIATAYAWVPNFKGDVTIDGAKSSPSLTRSDILDHLDMAFTGRLELQPPDSNWSFWTDLFYSRLQDDNSAATALGPVDLDFEAHMTFIEVAAAFHYWKSEESIVVHSRPTPRTHLDFYGGARHARMRNKADASIPALGLELDFDETEHWTDPIVGLRFRHGLTPRVWLVGRGDVGGFGVGADFAWTARATVQYWVSPQWSLGAGWQVMDLDYDDSDFEADLRMSGPFMMLSYAF